MMTHTNGPKQYDHTEPRIVQSLIKAIARDPDIPLDIFSSSIYYRWSKKLKTTITPAHAYQFGEFWSTNETQNVAGYERTALSGMHLSKSKF